ncbi:MAG: lipopolysaccharide biosynthesis protein [Elusimicrobiota bacterium]
MNREPSDPLSRLFENRHLEADIGNLAVRGGAVKIASQAARFALRIGGVVIMARLVKPADVGVFLMATSVMLLLEVFDDFGLSRATVQRPRIDHRLISTLFWINAGVGLLMGMVTAATAPLLAWFYDDPRVLTLALAMSAPFVLTGLAFQHGALLERQLRMVEIEIIAFVAQVCGAAVMFASAWWGAGYWSLALNLIVIRLVESSLVWWTVGWCPGWPQRGCGARAMLQFGGHLSGYHIVNYFHRNLDNILIGRYWGPQDLGFYSKAYGLLKQPISQISTPISSVIVPALSRLQDSPERYRRYFLKAAKAVVFLSMPMVVFTYVDAPEIIRALLGERWMPAVPIFRALAPAAFVGTTQMFGGWFYQSLGRTDRMFKSGTAVLGVMIVAFSASVPWGNVAVAKAYSVAYCLVAIPALAYATQGTPVRLLDILRAIRWPILVSLACGVATFALRSAWRPSDHAFTLCAIDGAFYCLTYAAAWMSFPGGRNFISSILTPFLRRVRESSRRQT